MGPPTMSNDQRMYVKSEMSAASSSKLMAAVAQPTRLSGQSIAVVNGPKERKVIYIAPVENRGGRTSGGGVSRQTSLTSDTPPRSYESASSSSTSSSRNVNSSYRITPVRQMSTPPQSQPAPQTSYDTSVSHASSGTRSNRPLSVNHQNLGQIPLNLNSGGSVSSRREKANKGLRHFAMRVCQKVRQKVVTSYNEVADELVGEMTEMGHQSLADKAYDQKNIRRRVYDALNVLMAMRIITKEKKEIKWLGLPTNYEERYREMEDEKRLAQERIRAKVQNMQELLLQQIAVRQLIEKNRQREAQEGGPPPSDSTLRLPFIVVSTVSYFRRWNCTHLLILFICRGVVQLLTAAYLLTDRNTF